MNDYHHAKNRLKKVTVLQIVNIHFHLENKIETLESLNLKGARYVNKLDYMDKIENRNKIEEIDKIENMDHL